MADPHPLQRGDRSQDLSDYNFSNEADRRSQETYTPQSNPMYYHGEFPAADQARPEGGRLWKVGQAVPNFQAPWNVIAMDGDNNGMPAEVHELNMDMYGDCYDPTAPARVRTADWHVDTDHDGNPN